MNKQEVIERLNNKLGETFAFQRSFEPLTWAHMECESKANAYMTAINYVEQLDEPQKVKVPAFVAPFIEKLKITNSRYGVELEKAYNNEEDEELVNWLWFNENVLTLFRALEKGYEVEEEPKYRVNIGGLYLKEPLADTNDFTISMTWNKDYAYPFDSWNMAREHTSDLGGTVEKVEV